MPGLDDVPLTVSRQQFRKVKAEDAGNRALNISNGNV
jgi:hypothetical protein